MLAGAVLLPLVESGTFPGALPHPRPRSEQWHVRIPLMGQTLLLMRYCITVCSYNYQGSSQMNYDLRWEIFVEYVDSWVCR